MLVLLCETMRYKDYGSDDRRPKLPDLLLATRSIPAPVLSFARRDPKYYSYIAYSIATFTSPGEAPHMDLLEDDGFYNEHYITFKLNSPSGQPLSLSLRDDIDSRQPSWSVNWGNVTKRFLLNHPASSFSASKRLRSEQASTGDEYCINHTEGQRMRRRGFVVDAVRGMSDYLPPRRHCDHYDVDDHCLFFVNWYEYAKNHSSCEQDTVLLDYADTIQARGCGHIWDDETTTPQGRIQKARAFLDFLSDEDADESDVTNSIRLFHAACFPSHDRRFAVTDKGHFCLVPKDTQSGDFVCIPYNSRVPYIFRPRIEGDGFINIGEAFVHGIMHGQMSEPKDCEEMEFVLY
jgi:hypothetical protein